MKIKEKIRDVMEHESVKNLEGCYLVHFFKMFEKEKNENFQLGMYSPKEDKIIPIECEGDKIEVGEMTDAFKKGETINKLNLDNVNVDYEEMMLKADALQKEEYKGQDPIKVILILQNIDGVETYNITFITLSFKTLNMRFDAKTGDRISDKLTSIFEFKKGDSGAQ